MKILDLIEQLLAVRASEGNIEVTCTGSTLEDGHGGAIPDVFETTVGHLGEVSDHETFGRRVRLHM